MQQDAGIVSHHCHGKKYENKYGTKRAKISPEMSEEVEIHCESVMTQLITVLIVKLCTGIEKSKVSIELFL